MLRAIESLLSAVVADGMSGQKHESNTELFGQGLANIFAPFNYDIRREMYKSDFLDMVGRHHLYRKFESALHKAKHDLALHKVD